MPCLLSPLICHTRLLAVRPAATRPPPQTRPVVRLVHSLTQQTSLRTSSAGRLSGGLGKRSSVGRTHRLVSPAHARFGHRMTDHVVQGARQRGSPRASHFESRLSDQSEQFRRRPVPNRAFSAQLGSPEHHSVESAQAVSMCFVLQQGILHYEAACQANRAETQPVQFMCDSNIVCRPSSVCMQCIRIPTPSPIVAYRGM